MFGGTDPNDAAPSYDECLAILSQVEVEFLEQANNSKWSPYVFELTVAGENWKKRLTSIAVER